MEVLTVALESTLPHLPLLAKAKKGGARCRTPTLWSVGRAVRGRNKPKGDKPPRAVTKVLLSCPRNTARPSFQQYHHQIRASNLADPIYKLQFSFQNPVKVEQFKNRCKQAVFYYVSQESSSKNLASAREKK